MIFHCKLQTSCFWIGVVWHDGRGVTWGGGTVCQETVETFVSCFTNITFNIMHSCNLCLLLTVNTPTLEFRHFVNVHIVRRFSDVPSGTRVAHSSHVTTIIYCLSVWVSLKSVVTEHHVFKVDLHHHHHHHLISWYERCLETCWCFRKLQARLMFAVVNVCLGRGLVFKNG